ncbi:hypothetical protein WG66_008412 [Moniliophthora roreri]|nr:hypothetical protein WG66_008412 [Moniliophthora roreri]
MLQVDNAFMGNVPAVLLLFDGHLSSLTETYASPSRFSRINLLHRLSLCPSPSSLLAVLRTWMLLLFHGFYHEASVFFTIIRGYGISEMDSLRAGPDDDPYTRAIPPSVLTCSKTGSM